MAVKLIIFISLVLQLAAAAVACRLLPVSRRHPGIYVFIAAVALILVRRVASFAHVLSVTDPADFPVVYEAMALTVSLLLLLAAVWSVPRIRQYITGRNELFQKHSNICQVIHDLAVPAFVLGKDHTVTHWNKACENLTGIAARDMVGSREAWKAFYREERLLLADLILDEVAPEEYARHYGDASRPSITLEGGWEVEAFLPALGEGRWISFAASPLRNLEGAICGAIETFQDTTPQKTAGLVLSRSASGLRTLHEIIREISGEKTVPGLLDLTVRLLKEKMHISNVAILENAAEKRERDVRLRLKASSGLDAAAMERLTEDLRRSGLGLSTRAALSRKVLVTADVSKSTDYVPFFEGSVSEIDVPILDGEKVLGVVTVEGYAPFDSQEEEFLTILAGHLASLWKSLELVAEVENLALTDQLTGLPNRRALFQKLDSEDNRLNRYGGKMSIVMIDMTGFKEVNGTYGHLVGDSALQAASHCVRDCLRESVFVARFGGDEFVVLMPETGAEEAAVLQRADDRMYVEKASPGNN